MAREQSFLGRGWAFPPEFHRTGVNMVELEQDIRQSLTILLGTRPNERVMEPEYGCGLQAMVFDTIDASNVTQIKDTIHQAIMLFEPRIDLDEIVIDDSAALEGTLLIDLHYTIRSTNNRSNMVYPFYFLEGTNLR